MSNRNANYKLLEKVGNFVPCQDPNRVNGTCANIEWDVEGKFKIGDKYEERFKGNNSSPWVLARLCALFEGLKIEVLGQPGYKVTWETILVHVPTGHVVTFYDYKGGISYGSDVYGKAAPKAFVSDLKKLLKVLSDPRCPHPYDGCVVGEEA